MRSADLEAELLRESVGEHGQRAGQTEIVERLGSQLDRDPPHVVQAVADGVLEGERPRPRGPAVPATRSAERPQQHRGELLADLVVQLLGDPQPLSLLGAEHAAGGLPPLGLQAREHLVEGQRELRPPQRWPRGARHPLTQIREIDLPGERGQRLNRARSRCAAGRRSRARPGDRREHHQHLSVEGERRRPFPARAPRSSP